MLKTWARYGPGSKPDVLLVLIQQLPLDKHTDARWRICWDLKRGLVDVILASIEGAVEVAGRQAAVWVGQRKGHLQRADNGMHRAVDGRHILSCT